MATGTRTGFPTYTELLYPVLQAVAVLGGSAKSSEITAQVVEDTGVSEEQLAVTYETRPNSIVADRIAWAISYNKLGGALDSPKRSLYLLTALGKEILALTAEQAEERLRAMDREVRSERTKKRAEATPADAEGKTSRPPAPRASRRPTTPGRRRCSGGSTG